MKEDIEKIIIQYSSIPIAVLICGSLLPEFRAPIETAVSNFYKKINPKTEKVY